jgi:hypothetical protein
MPRIHDAIGARLAAQDAPTVTPGPFEVPDPEAIFIGVRDGVLWQCHREPGESDERWQARAWKMLAAFVA